MHTSKVRVSWEHGATETGKMETSAFDTLFNFEGPKGGRKGRRRPFLSAEETSIGGEKHASEGQRDFPAEEQRPRKDGGVAQLGEHLPCKQGVDSSNLFISTTAAPSRTRLRVMETLLESPRNGRSGKKKAVSSRTRWKVWKRSERQGPKRRKSSAVGH